MRVAITGGTGFVGGHLAASLAAGGHEVVVLARGVDRRPWAMDVRRSPGVTVVEGSISDEDALAKAFAGCDAVAHCAGINREIGRQTYRAVHVEGTRNVVRATEKAGVSRLVLVSFLRARPDCGSPYHESKWAAEEIVRSSTLDWTVLKPGMMFGRGDHMLEHLSRALRTFPIYLGVGNRMVRPLAVEDAVAVMHAALIEGRLARKTIALLGPTRIGFDDAARMIGRVIGKRRLFVRVPTLFHRLLARVAERAMEVPLISTAQVRMLEEELVSPALAPDDVPDDLRPATAFDEGSIRAGVPPSGRFRLRDLRVGPRRSRGTNGGIELCGEGEAIIARSPIDVLEFVLDVDRYRRADLKIGRVHFLRRDGLTGEVRHAGRFLGLPMPAVTLSFELTPSSRLDFRAEKVPWPLRGFEGSFTCEETPGGTRVVHRECFTLAGISGRLLAPVLRRWISRDTPAEVIRMKRILEAEQRGRGR